MAVNINSVVVTGNLTRDPELRTTGGGTSVCSLRLAVNGRTKRGDEWVDDPNYFDVTIWGKQGENAARYLTKGRGVAVSGRLDWREYTDKHDNKRQAVQIVAENVQFLSDGQQHTGGDSAAASGGGNGQPAAAAAPAGNYGDDDIPF